MPGKKYQIRKIKVKPLKLLDISGIDFDQYFKEFYEPDDTSTDDNTAGIILEDKKTVISYSQIPYNQESLQIIEPNLVLIYLSTAHDHSIRSMLAKEIFLSNYKKDNFKAYLPLVEFIRNTTLAIIMFYSSLEAFINQQIPEEYIFVDKRLKRYTKSYDKVQIEKFLTFDDKLRHIIPDITGFDVYKEENEIYNVIKKIEDIRNELIHLKVNNSDEIKKEFIKLKVNANGSLHTYKKISERLFNLELSEYYKSVSEFITKISPELIEFMSKEEFDSVDSLQARLNSSIVNAR